MNSKEFCGTAFEAENAFERSSSATNIQLAVQATCLDLSYKIVPFDADLVLFIGASFSLRAS